MAKLYTMIPRAVGPFHGLDMATRYAFGLIYDRWKLSDREENRESFSDAFGVYCFYDRQDLAEEMGVTLPTVRKAIKTLIDKKIIRARRAGVGAAWRYYVTVFALLHLDDDFAAALCEITDDDPKDGE